MKQIDRYYNFLISAISTPLVSAEFYYFYDIKHHKLIKTNQSNLENKCENLIQLPRLETKIKKEFLINFAKNQKDEIEKYLLKKIDQFNDKSEMNLQQGLKKFGIVAVKLDLLSGQFLVKSAEKKYKKYNLTEDMEIELVMLSKG